MKVEQIYSLLNTVTGEVLGKSDIVAEDLSNVVDLGKEVFSNTDVDNYVKSLINHIGKVIFTNREYSGNVPSVLMDGWEYGSVLEKISADIPEAQENDSWNLEDKKQYPYDTFYKPSVSAKFYNSKNTFEIPMSFTEMQLKESFSNAQQLNGFMSMIDGSIKKSMTIKTDGMIMRTINNMIAQTLHAEFPSVNDGNYSAVSGIKAINLLKLYNDKFNSAEDAKKLTAEQALTSPEFIRFATFELGMYRDRMGKISTLFNIGKKERFTPSDALHVVMLSDFSNSAKIYLQSDTFNKELVALPNAETVPYWQASGTDYSFNNVSDIHVNIKTGNSTSEIVANGILAVMFDHDALGVCNQNERTTTAYNPKGEFYSSFYKYDCSYFNDENENFVVFFIA